jgi:hypothetical protein
MRRCLVLLVATLAASCAARHPAPAPSAPSAGSVSSASPAPAPAASPAAAAPVAATSPGAAPAVRPPGPPPLVGSLTRAALEDYATWKTLRAQDDALDEAAVRTIARQGRDVDVLLVLGTWCGDSKRAVPRFFKALDEAQVSLDRVTMIGVDRTKKDAEGLTEKHRVTRVPTFIFFRGGKEIGRVTEKAATTIEGDVAAILEK